VLRECGSNDRAAIASSDVSYVACRATAECVTLPPLPVACVTNVLFSWHY